MTCCEEAVTLEEAWAGVGVDLMTSYPPSWDDAWRRARERTGEYMGSYEPMTINAPPGSTTRMYGLLSRDGKPLAGQHYTHVTFTRFA